jgi:beta-lactamase superfamily II metal-dependent hydrolase
MSNDSFEQARTKYDSGDYKVAARLFLALVRQNPDDHRSWNALGATFIKLGKNSSGDKCLQKALLLDPDNQKYQQNLLYLRKKVKKKSAKQSLPHKNTSYYFRAAILALVLLISLAAGAYIISGTFGPDATRYGTTIGTISIPSAEPTYEQLSSVAVTKDIEGRFSGALPPLKTAAQQQASGLKIHFLDVGQGDSILLQAGGKNMLIDAGPKDTSSKVISYLKSAGVTKLDVVVASHPHEDHIGGMTSVLSAFPVARYIDSGATHTTSTFESVMDKLKKDQTPYSEAKRGDTIPFVSGINVLVLGPARITGDLNEDAIVLKITDGNMKILLTGDSTTWSEPTQILKVPHHGSAKSTDYIQKVNPQVAIISVGAGNSYNHPAKSSVDTITRIGAKLFRTDQDGTVIITTDGKTWSTKTLAANKLSIKSTNIPPVALKTVIQSTTRGSSQSFIGSAPCNCKGTDLDCKDFAKGQGQICYDYCISQGYGDIFRLDGDKDGKACE